MTQFPQFPNYCETCKFFQPAFSHYLTQHGFCQHPQRLKRIPYTCCGAPRVLEEPEDRYDYSPACEHYAARAHA